MSRSRDFVGDLELAGRMRNSGDRLTFFNAIVFSIVNGDGRSLGCGVGFVQGSAQLRATLAKGAPFLSRKERAQARWMLEREARQLEAEMR